MTRTNHEVYEDRSGSKEKRFADFMFPLPKKTRTKTPMTTGSGRDL